MTYEIEKFVFRAVLVAVAVAFYVAFRFF